MHITLRPNEKIYINGAVLRVDRKVSLELMNDAVFLLEAHVMLERNATTPLRRLYFIVQLMLMEPHDLEPKRILFQNQVADVAASTADSSILTGLAVVSELVVRNRSFEALKVIRSMLPIEDAIVGGTQAPAAPVGAVQPVRRPSVRGAVKSAPALAVAPESLPAA